MNAVWLVALRDYREVVFTRTFLLLLLAFPVLLTASMLVPHLLEKNTGPVAIALVDLPAGWEQILKDHYEGDPATKQILTLSYIHTESPAERKQKLTELQADVRIEKLYGYMTVDRAKDGTLQPALTTRTASRNDGVGWLYRTFPVVVRFDRAREMGLTSEQVLALNKSVDITSLLLPREPGEAKEASETDKIAAYAPVAFTYLLWITILTLVQKLLISTVEEKSNRTVEILLSSLTDFQFIGGKVLAGVLEGLTVLIVWTATLAFGAKYISDHYLPGVDLSVIFEHKAHLVFFLVYFALGFVLFASLVVGIGALCSSVKDTQNLMTPIMMLMVVPVLVMSYVGDNPNSRLSVGLSYFPFFTPFLMMNRIAATPPPHPLEIAASIVVLLISIWGTTWAGAKLFRMGILMYGKPPTFAEMIKILKSREGRRTVRPALQKQ